MKKMSTMSFLKNLIGKRITINKLPLEMGIASVSGRKEELKIYIHSYQGKTYEFKTNGNAITSFEVDGKEYNYEG